MWQSIENLLRNLKNEKYVFLRNYENISKDFDENDDWDILCENLEDFVRVCQAKSINESRYNYYTIVNGKRLLLDIRTVGDGYYDKKWERDILKKRKLYKDFYVVDEENRIFCTLYHALLQKNSDGLLKYRKYINDNFGTCDLTINIKQLADYMNLNGYKYSVPKDLGVYNNEYNVKMLIEELNNG